jgi:hypothetical protein
MNGWRSETPVYSLEILEASQEIPEPSKQLALSTTNATTAADIPWP